MTVMIKDNGNSRSSSLDQQLQQIGIVQNSKVANELISFQSPALILDVVKRLHLDMNYSTHGFFHDKPLYGSTLPIQVQFLSLGDKDAAKMVVKYKADGSYEMTGFASNRIGGIPERTCRQRSFQPSGEYPCWPRLGNAYFTFWGRQ